MPRPQRWRLVETFSEFGDPDGEGPYELLACTQQRKTRILVRGVTLGDERGQFIAPLYRSSQLRFEFGDLSSRWPVPEVAAEVVQQRGGVGVVSPLLEHGRVGVVEVVGITVGVVCHPPSITEP